MDTIIENEFDEYDLFEAEYADQLEMLDELEGLKTSNHVEDLESKENCGLPSLSQREPRRRKLFEPEDGPDNETVDESYDTGDLVIDEDELDCLINCDTSSSPHRKKAKLSETTNHYSLPTTLDSDRDEVHRKIQDERHKNLLSTPRLLEKIKQYRENRNNTKEFLQKSGRDAESNNSPIRLTKVLVRPPMHSDYMSVTSSDGQRVYMRMKKDISEKSLPASEMIAVSKSRGLLPHTMTELRQKIYDERQFDVVEESRRITDEIRRETLRFSSSINEDIEQSPEKDGEEEKKAYHRKEIVFDGLWVNKYAPTRYTHLLSDESVNRALLKWLKLWDGVVFGREPVVRKKSEIRKEKEKQQNKFQNKWKNKADVASFDDELDETKRPKYKAALLCGPPGLGKTTLAHIIAKHAGYHVVEMNASDDRSAEIFQKKLEETTQMKSVLGTNQRPNCLIIDEIDGAPQAAINILLTAMNRVKMAESKRKKSKAGAGGVLLRPIICICNDLYVPALRQLRQNSFILQFPPTTTAKLASRLRQMCLLQELECDTTVLLALCEKSSNDIRTCVNTLQFLQAKEKKLSLDAIHGLPIGQKDQHQSVFYVWNEVFQQPKGQRKIEKNSLALQHLSEGQKITQFSARFYHVLNVVIANGEYEKILQGVFENYLLMKFKDCGMQAVNKAYEWLSLYDHLNQEILSHQEWTLMRYIPYLFVVFHLLFSCLAPPRIQFPQVVQENRQKLQKSEHLLSSLYSDMSPCIRAFASPSVALLEIVPHLLTIMTPNIRAVNMQLYNQAEKRQLHDLVSSMLSYNLTFRQERNQDGQYNYVLEPDMSEVCHFAEKESAARRLLSYAIKQTIAKEVETERMRRTEKLKIGKMQEQIKKKEEKGEKSEKKASMPNHLQRLESSMNTIKVPVDKPVMNFFSRFTKIKRVDEHGKEKTSKKSVEIRDPGIGNSELWYKYNEGFSNAVRQKVYVKDFL